jgi:exodeoxyribonuclease VII small subunit
MNDGAEMDERNGPAEQRFEDGMAALEALVARLESGELALEDALVAFEQGVALVRALNARLDAAEQRIELLVRGSDGRLRLQAAGDEDA